MTNHFVLDGKIRFYQRANTKKWHRAARIDGKNKRKSTGEADLARAIKVAEDWYFSLRSGEEPPKQQTATGNRSFSQVAEIFVD